MTTKTKTGRPSGTVLRSLGAGLAILATLIWAESRDYLLFHSLAELFSVVIAASAYLVAWNTRRYQEDSFLVFLGAALLAIASLDLVHMLVYTGMGVFPGEGANEATQLWIAARALTALSLLVAPLLVGRRIPYWILAPAFGGVVLVVLLAVFLWKIFPTCYVEGRGLTPFKRYAEYAICLVLAGALSEFWRQRRAFAPSVVAMLLGATGVMIVEELAFTFYSDPYGTWNFVGHTLKILAFYLIYKAIVETGLARPYDLLFRGLQQSRRELQRLNEDLEARVAARTAEAEERAAQLRLLAAELTRAEERERRRLAQVLHDHLQQLLVAAGMRIGVARDRASEPSARENLSQTAELLSQAVEASRSLTAELSPPVIYEAGLLAGLRWLADRTGRTHRLAVEIEAEADVEEQLDQDLRLFLFRAAGEFVFNAVKYAGVDSVALTVAGDGEGRIRLEVTDRGRGFELAAEPRGDAAIGGFGLFSIRERARLLGGALEIESAPGAGTRACLVVPARSMRSARTSPSALSAPLAEEDRTA